MNSVQASYFAGLLDGEGTICIWRTVRQRDKNTNRTPLYSLQVSIGMIEPALAIYELHRLWQGWIGKSGAQPKRFGCKNGAIVRWYKTSKEAYEFLKVIYPYLIVKKEQAELAIKFQEALMTNRAQGQWREGSRWVARPEDVTSLYESYHQAMRDLNHRLPHQQRLSETTPSDGGEAIV